MPGVPSEEDRHGQAHAVLRGGRASTPVREGHWTPGTPASRPRSAMPNSPTASRSANGSSAASERRSTPFRDGLLAGSDPVAAGRMGLSGSILPAAGRSHPRQGSADRHRRSGRRGATVSAPATWTAGALSGRTAISCPAIPKVNRTRRNRHHHLVTAVITGLPTALAESQCREVVESSLRGGGPELDAPLRDVPCAAQEREPDDTGVAAGH